MAGYNNSNQGIMKDSIMPPFRIMFQSASVPSSANLDLYLAELDAQLEENNKEIDTCMQSILQYTRELPGGVGISDPKEGLTHMINNHILENDSCYDPEVDDSVAILNGLLSMIEENPGSEERVLQEILSLSAAEGLVFPLLTSSSSSLVPISMTSLHTIEDTTDQQIEAKWNKITQRLKKHFVEKLLRLPAQKTNLPGIPVNQRLRLLQCLSAIAPDEEVWQCYQNLRTQQLEKNFRDLFPESDTLDYQSFSSHCNTIASSIINMIDEDFVVLNTGMFRKVIGVFKAIHDLYLEKYSDEMSLLVEEVSDDIFKIRHNTFAHGNPQKNQLKLQKGQSLDSIMPSRNTESLQPQGAAIVNAGCIQSLLHIIKSLLVIEEHINTLLRNTAWDVIGVSTKKAKKRGSLRGVLKTSSSPEQRRHSLRMTELNNSDTQIDTSMSSTNSSIVQTPKVIERTKTEERLHWDWKLMFKKISGDITQAVEASINNSINTCLQEEWEQWQNTHTLTQVDVNETLQGGKQDYPKVISKSVKEFFDTCDRLLVFARAGCDGSLSPVRAAYIDNISTSLKLFHEHIIKICIDIPVKGSIMQLFVLLSNAVYCRNELTYCENVLCTDDAGKKVFVGLLKQLSDLVESLSKQVLDIHNQLLSSSVLHDAESHHWTDSKDFYEDERCSYTVHMWNYHMRGLKYDLWTICPPRLSQYIFGSVFHESLQMLTQRYVRVKPSFRRVNQFRYDITAILICSSEFLFQVCQSTSQYLDPGHCDIPQYNIHNLCSTLLSAMAVIASPIDQLYRIFKRGYGKRRDSQSDSMPGSTSYCGFSTQWLHWIQPSLFLPGQKHYDDMQTTNAVYLQVKMLLNQFIWEPSTLLQALIMKDYTLPIMLLTRVASLESVSNSASSVVNNLQEKKDIFTAVITILAQCPHFPDGVAKVLMPVIDRCEDWDVLNAKKLSTLECEPPVWMLALFELIKPYIDSVLEPLIVYVLNLPSLVTGKGCLIPEIQELPCGCSPNKYDTDYTSCKKGERYIIESALRIVVTELSEKIHALNAAFCVACNLLQEACHQNNLKTPHNCAGLIIIGRCIRERLLDAKYIQFIIGQEVQEETCKLLTVLADCIYSVLIFGRAKSSISTPKMASQFVKANKEWLTSKIKLVSVHLSNELFSVPDTDILEGSTSNFADHIFTAAAASILNDSNGFNNLTMTFNLIKRNWLWIEEQLDIRLSFKDNNETKTAQFDMNLTLVKEEKFIPQKEFNQIGNTSLNQDFLLEFPFNWSHILKSDLGLSENAFSALLYNRHEMQDGAYLEENEKRPVEILRSLFERDSSEMN